MTDTAIEIFCPVCGYDLRGGGGERCPECGTSIDHEALARSQIPWSHRQQIGRFRAYWRTVWLATFHAKRLAQEASRPVDYRDARLFRIVTVLLVGLPIAAAVGIAAAKTDWSALPGEAMLSSSQPPLWIFDLLTPFAAGASVPGLLPVCTPLFLLAATAAPSVWFRPQSLSSVKRDRAVALSSYACAPLVFISVAIVIGAVAFWLDPSPVQAPWRTYQFVLALAIIAWIVAVASLLLWWLATLRLLRHTTHADVFRTLVVATGFPLTLALLGGLILGLIPCVVGFVIVVVESLR
jgi:hypothetical protein